MKYHCVTRWRAPVGNLSTIRENPFHNVTLFNKNVVTLCLGKGKHHFLKNYSKGSMATNTKNILALDTNEAFDFLMRSEHFLSFERPLYFDFDEVLGFVRKTETHHPRTIFRFSHFPETIAYEEIDYNY